MDGQFPIGANGWVSIIAPDSTVVWQWKHIEMGNEALHHDFEVMPNGNILAICYAIVSAEEAYALGWRHQRNRETVVIDKVIEICPYLAAGEAKVVWEWSTQDHFVQDTDSTLPNFGKPADYPERIDINWAQLGNAQFNSGQLFHANSVSYHAEEDIILLSSAVFGEIWAIDHSTTTQEAKGSTGGTQGRGGDLLWRYGNPQTHGQGTAEDQTLYWQHDAHFIPNSLPRSGEILIFNNGMRRSAESTPEPEQICMGMITGAYSDVREISLPRSSDGSIETGAPPELNWSFNTDGANDFYSPFMSGAQRMPNGNTLMCQACDKRIVEVTPTGQIVLDFHVGGSGRLFRIYKFAPDDPAIRALGL